MTVGCALALANLLGALHADWLCMVHDTVLAALFRNHTLCFTF